jgi:hypothetical protein
VTRSLSRKDTEFDYFHALSFVFLFDPLCFSVSLCESSSITMSLTKSAGKRILLLTPHTSRLTPHASRLTSHTFLCVPLCFSVSLCVSSSAPHASCPMPHTSLLTPHSSHLIPHLGPFRELRNIEVDLRDLHHIRLIKLEIKNFEVFFHMSFL